MYQQYVDTKLHVYAYNMFIQNYIYMHAICSYKIIYIYMHTIYAHAYMYAQYAHTKYFHTKHVHTKYAHTKCVRAYIVCKYFVCKGREREGGREVERERHKQKGGESDARIGERQISKKNHKYRNPSESVSTVLKDSDCTSFGTCGPKICIHSHVEPKKKTSLKKRLKHLVDQKHVDRKIC